MKDKTRARDGRRISAWIRSAEFKIVARKALEDINSRRDKKPKCGAHARTTGEPCKRLAMANGRCHAHGGRTPKGNGWHKPRWPDAGRPDAIERLDQKLRDLRKAAKKRAARLASMTDDERTVHENWQRAHRPGTKGERDVARRDRIEAARIAAAMDAPEAINPEVAQIQAEIERLEALLRKPEHSIFD